MSETTKKVGQAIKQARISQGLTQKEMGEKMGVSEATFNRYETGKQNLTIDTLQKIADALENKLNITFNK
ncbi:hypothetical protein GCM10028807_60280 [Spirosoma daeguense]